ncbi:polysaccharide deacetylase family protein [Citrobacter braakii]|uniref:polysaccharide deacetylase family protein n=1 Tax=Citrobacter braakii TaxID=57706 RepID=UPI003C2F16E2
MKKLEKLPVLMYHHVVNHFSPVSFSLRTFRAQMKFLVKSGWKTLTTREVEDFFLCRSLPHKSVMLTFDFGWLNYWLYIFPILKEFNLHAHIFLVTGLISDGKVRYPGEQVIYSLPESKYLIKQGRADEVMLRWSEIREMYLSGLVEFHSQTHTHKRWDQLSSIKNPLDFLRSDILLSREWMREMLGSDNRHLCWPEGYYTDEHIKVAEELGFSYLYTMEQYTNSPLDGTQRIGRISAWNLKDRPRNSYHQ